MTGTETARRRINSALYMKVINVCITVDMLCWCSSIWMRSCVTCTSRTVGTPCGSMSLDESREISQNLSCLRIYPQVVFRTACATHSTFVITSSVDIGCVDH